MPHTTSVGTGIGTHLACSFILSRFDYCNAVLYVMLWKTQRPAKKLQTATEDSIVHNLLMETVL